MIAISIGNGRGDAQGGERSLEYDNLTPVYAEFVEIIPHSPVKPLRIWMEVGAPIC